MLDESKLSETYFLFLRKLYQRTKLTEDIDMKTNITQTIDSLKAKVRSNLMDIQNNQKIIRDLLKQSVSPERSSQLEEGYALNKVLLSENNDLINVQLTLSNFLDKYSNSDIFEMANVAAPSISISLKECFEKTINGELGFNSQHPFYNDDSFFQKLMTHYQQSEDYENCSRIMQEKSQDKG